MRETESSQCHESRAQAVDPLKKLAENLEPLIVQNKFVYEFSLVETNKAFTAFRAGQYGSPCVPP